MSSHGKKRRHSHHQNNRSVYPEIVDEKKEKEDRKKKVISPRPEAKPPSSLMPVNKIADFYLNPTEINRSNTSGSRRRLSVGDAPFSNDSLDIISKSKPNPPIAALRGDNFFSRSSYPNLPHNIQTEILMNVKVERKPIAAYQLSRKHQAIENKIMKESEATISIKNGPRIETFSSGLPRRKMYVSLSEPSIITHNIVIGSKKDAANEECLRRYGITHILNVAQQIPNFFPELFVYHKISILDSPDVNIVSYFHEAASFIKHVQNMNGRVLVHCVSGVSRSVVLVILYLMVESGLLLKEAYDYVFGCRPYISPNEGFKFQMALFELEFLGKSSVADVQNKEWDFYEWNRIRKTVTVNSCAVTGKTQRGECCIIM